MVALVTDIVMDADGTAAASGVDDDDITADAGYHFGFYSRPNDGATGIVVKLGGAGGKAVLIAWRDKQYEISLNKGECAMANAFGAQVLLDKNGIVNLNGSNYALVKDAYLTDVANLLLCVSEVLLSTTGAGPLTGAALAAADAATDPESLATNLLEIPRLVSKLNVVASYKSQKVKFG